MRGFEVSVMFILILNSAETLVKLAVSDFHDQRSSVGTGRRNVVGDHAADKLEQAFFRKSFAALDGVLARHLNDALCSLLIGKLTTVSQIIQCVAESHKGFCVAQNHGHGAQLHGAVAEVFCIEAGGFKRFLLLEEHFIFLVGEGDNFGGKQHLRSGVAFAGFEHLFK